MFKKVRLFCLMSPNRLKNYWTVFNKSYTNRFLGESVSLFSSTPIYYATGWITYESIKFSSTKLENLLFI